MVALIAVAAVDAGCLYHVKKGEGGGQTDFEGERRVDAADVALPRGYVIRPVATGLTFPTGVTFDGEGRVYVTEAGYSYGEAYGTPRLLRVEPDGATTEIARGDNPPWNGVTFHDGAFYVAGGHTRPGEILRVTPAGEVTPVVQGLTTSLGDHHTNGPVVGPDGALYFGQGTLTNSGVVGADNAEYGWLRKHPDLRDLPCKDVVLTGRNYTSKNPLGEGEATTGPFKPFGTPATEGEVVPGEKLCGGAVFRVPLAGGEPEVVAWGLRNPFGLAFSPDGTLYVTENQFDARGSRPVFGAGDLLWRIEPGKWYGWPDYWGAMPLTREGWFGAPEGPPPGFVMKDHPNVPPQPVARFGVHSSADGLDFSRSADFGHVGQAFVALYGDIAPNAGKVLSPVGFRVVRVEVDTGVMYDFAVNRGETANGPASWLEGSGGLERPVAVRFSPDGRALYVVDFGVLTSVDRKLAPRPRTGVLWRIERASP